MLLLRSVRKCSFALGILLLCVIVGMWFASAFIFNPVSWHVNVDSISPVVAPDLKNIRGQELLIVILVTSAPSNFQARMTIRQTWGYEDSSITRVSRFQVIFMLGTSNKADTEAQIRQEASRYGDLLVGSFEDSYGNLPLKSVSSLRWALGIRSRYVVKTDDDMYICTPRLVKWLEDFKLPRLYAGRVRHNAQVIRFRFHRYSVSYSNFPESFYPPYCYGGFYVLSHNALTQILDASNLYHPFAAEDAYIGVLAREIGLKPIDLSRKIFLVKSNYWKQIDVDCLADDAWNNAIAIGDSLKPHSLEYVHRKVAVEVKSFQEGRALCEKSTGHEYTVFLMFGLITAVFTIIRFCKKKHVRRVYN